MFIPGEDELIDAKLSTKYTREIEEYWKACDKAAEQGESAPDQPPNFESKVVRVALYKVELEKNGTARKSKRSSIFERIKETATNIRKLQATAASIKTDTTAIKLDTSEILKFVKDIASKITTSGGETTLNESKLRNMTPKQIQSAISMAYGVKLQMVAASSKANEIVKKIDKNMKQLENLSQQVERIHAALLAKVTGPMHDSIMQKLAVANKVIKQTEPLIKTLETTTVDLHELTRDEMSDKVNTFKETLLKMCADMDIVRMAIGNMQIPEKKKKKETPAPAAEDAAPATGRSRKGRKSSGKDKGQQLL